MPRKNAKILIDGDLGDFAWQYAATAGKITENGYQDKMAIPFQSLRFPQADAQN